MQSIEFTCNPYPKSQQLKHKRRTAKRKDRGRIKPETYRKVRERDRGQCILCGNGQNLHCHHHIYRSQLGKGTEDNLVMLCVRCHELAHSRRDIREMIGIYLAEKYKGADDGHD